MIEDLGIELIQMMENAGHKPAEPAVRRFHPSRVIVRPVREAMAGGGLVAARHLANRER